MSPVGQRARIAVLRRGDNGFRTGLFPIAAGEAGTGEKAFDAVRFAAVAGLRRAIALRSIARQRIMPPLPGDSVGAAEQLLMNGDPAAAAGTDNHPEDGGSSGAGAIHRLRKSEAVGIVCHPHRLAKLLHDIPAQIVTVEHRAVAVFNASALRIDSPGQADPGVNGCGLTARISAIRVSS